MNNNQQKFHPRPLDNADRQHLHKLLTVNTVGLADRCRRYRRRRTAARAMLQIAAAVCRLAVIPVTAAKTLPTHRDYMVAISPSGHAVAKSMAMSIHTMLCTQ